MPLICLATLMLFTTSLPAQETYQSHPPLRPLPEASSRPLASSGPCSYVDPLEGNDANDGSKEKPWRTLAHAVKQLKPGDTLCLRGGIYYEHVKLKQSGALDQPITIRSFPGEIAILDGGIREFLENPADAWEPVPDGAKDEYRSKEVYPEGCRGGNFADSMIPLLRYLPSDFRSTNEFWGPGLGDKGETKDGIYFGPGLMWDRATQRIHIRLSHTTLKGLGDRHYRGETDPRKIPIIVGQKEHVLEVEQAKHVRIHDLIFRGAAAPISITGAEDVELDQVTIYAGSYGLQIGSTRKLRIMNSAFRGRAAPWHARAHHKNRAGVGYLVFAQGDNDDFEIAFSEFTDHHDGLKIGTVDFLRFHHNVVDNLNDDGIEFTPKGPWGTYHIYQNRLSRCLAVFSLHGGAPVDFEKSYGAYIYRNVIDLRKGVYKGPGRSDGTSEAKNRDSMDCPPKLIAEHGGGYPYPPMFFYHNTILARDNSENARMYAQGAGAEGIGQSRRRVFNNILAQPSGKHGYFFKLPNKIPRFAIPAGVDLMVNGNLFWSLEDGETRQSDGLPSHWSQVAPHDRYADPRFVNNEGDFRVRPESPAVNQGIKIPADWEDPLRARDQAEPDIGAFPLGVESWKVGVNGRILVLSTLKHETSSMMRLSSPLDCGCPVWDRVPNSASPFAAVDRSPVPKLRHVPIAATAGISEFLNHRFDLKRRLYHGRVSKL